MFKFQKFKPVMSMLLQAVTCSRVSHLSHYSFSKNNVSRTHHMPPTLHHHRHQFITIVINSSALPWSSNHQLCHGHQLTSVAMVINLPALPWSSTYQRCHHCQLTSVATIINSPALPWSSTHRCCYCHQSEVKTSKSS